MLILFLWLFCSVRSRTIKYEILFTITYLIIIVIPGDLKEVFIDRMEEGDKNLSQGIDSYYLINSNRMF